MAQTSATDRLGGTRLPNRELVRARRGLGRRPGRVSPTGRAITMASMRVGVVDVGANTLRLLVADVGPDGLSAVRTDRVQLGLGEDIEDRGAISSERLVAARRGARSHAATARRLGCSRVVVVVTSPGRQAANADDLLEALTSRGVTVSVLSAEEEATFAYRGALAGVEDLPEIVAVCDVGGGSTQLVVGSREEDPV